jgi:hypothetical protein
MACPGAKTWGKIETEETNADRRRFLAGSYTRYVQKQHLDTLVGKVTVSSQIDLDVM